jgi:NTP pyrophosphatase (non-canonical NTP hydrolase)
MNGEFYVDLNPISKAVAEFVKEKGFYTPSSLEGEADLVLSKLMLIVSELSEAAEAARKPDAQGAIDREEKGNFAEEMADTLIRMYDLCGSLGVDLGLWVAKKMVKNAERPHKHGKVA